MTIQTVYLHSSKPTKISYTLLAHYLHGKDVHMDNKNLHLSIILYEENPEPLLKSCKGFL